MASSPRTAYEVGVSRFIGILLTWHSRLEYYSTYSSLEYRK
jgi:hypothetical protein